MAEKIDFPQCLQNNAAMDSSNMYIRVTMVTLEESNNLRDWLSNQLRSKADRSPQPINKLSAMESSHSSLGNDDAPFTIYKRPKLDIDDHAETKMNDDAQREFPLWDYQESEFGSPFSFAIIRCDSEHQRKEVMDALRSKAEEEKERHWDFTDCCCLEHRPHRIEDKFILLQDDCDRIPTEIDLKSTFAQSLPLSIQRRDIGATNGASTATADVNQPLGIGPMVTTLSDE